MRRKSQFKHLMLLFKITLLLSIVGFHLSENREEIPTVKRITESRTTRGKLDVPKIYMENPLVVITISPHKVTLGDTVYVTCKIFSHPHFIVVSTQLGFAAEGTMSLENTIPDSEVTKQLVVDGMVLKASYIVTQEILNLLPTCLVDSVKV